jgi:hypothetical protein
VIALIPAGDEANYWRRENNFGWKSSTYEGSTDIWFNFGSL